jgi:xanthine dehydrogenase accessory factor
VSYEIIRGIAASSEPVALATVVGVQGSAPRHLGTMMLFRPDGSAAGTVGGGKVELEAAAAASISLARGVSLGIEVELVGAEATGSAPICGGRVELSVEFVADSALYRAASAELERGSGVILVSEVVPPKRSKAGGLLRGVLDMHGVPIAREASDIDRKEGAKIAAAGLGFALSEGQRAYVRVKPADRLLILGGGHVGLALARFANELGFRVTVGDERPEYAALERFPERVETISDSYSNIVDGFRFGDSTYVVIATPSHRSDLECVRAVMGRGYRYAGFVGSKRKTRMILDRLVEEGFDRTEVASLRAPIGIDVGAETPGEIALSILVEIVAARRESPALAAMDADRIRRRA